MFEKKSLKFWWSELNRPEIAEKTLFQNSEKKIGCQGLGGGTARLWSQHFYFHEVKDWSFLSFILSDCVIKQPNKIGKIIFLLGRYFVFSASKFSPRYFASIFSLESPRNIGVFAQKGVFFEIEVSNNRPEVAEIDRYAIQ